MGNLCALTKSQDEIRRLFEVETDRTGNPPPLPGIFPNTATPIVSAAEGRCTVSMYRWGMPPPAFALNAVHRSALPPQQDVQPPVAVANPFGSAFLLPHAQGDLRVGSLPVALGRAAEAGGLTGPKLADDVTSWRWRPSGARGASPLSLKRIL